MNQDRLKNTIFFTIEYKGQSYRVSTFPNQFYSLMTLISVYLALPNFGICSGMGSCGTCMVNIKQKFSQVQQRMLACGILVNDDLSGSIIEICDHG
jgi:hypothetical protein